MDLMQMLTSGLGGSDVFRQLGEKVDANPQQVEQIAGVGIPTLLEAMNRNAQTPEGAASLSKALDDHKNDDVQNVVGFFDKVDSQDGSKILDHLLGGKKDNVASSLSKKTGMDTQKVLGLLALLAPLVLSAMAKKKQDEGVEDVRKIPEMTSEVTRNMKTDNKVGGLMGMVTSLLDQDGDGDFMDDIGKFTGLFKK